MSISCIKKKIANKYIVFSICYWLIAGLHFMQMRENNTFAAGGSDAVTQMYPAMLYISRVVREFFSSFITGDQFTFPMVEWSLGMGENTIATLNYYGLGDPFYLLAALISEDSLPHFFSVFLYARMYIGGLMCIALFYELDSKKSNGAYVIGALVYTFSGFSLYSNIFIIFVHAMMYAPMMFLGTERVIKGKKKGILFFSVFLYALSGFFFLYVSSIALIVYVVCSLNAKKIGLKRAIAKVFELLAEYIVGLLCASVVFIPAVLGFFSSSRAGNVSEFTLFWTFKDIKEFLINMFLPYYSKTQMMGMCVIAFVCIGLMLLQKKCFKYKVCILMLMLCMILPIVSVIMSGGLNYDRWQLVVILYFSYITFLMWDELDCLSRKQKIVLIGVEIVLVILGYMDGGIAQENYRRVWIWYSIFVLMLVLILPTCKKINLNKTGKILLFVVTVCSIAKSWSCVARDWTIDFVRQDDVVRELMPENKEEFYRIEYEKTFEEPRYGMNISFVLDYPGISQYFSIENGHYISAFDEWDTGAASWSNPGFDYRTILGTVSSVKYFIMHSENHLLIPYGYEEIAVSEDKMWTLYENQYALPIVYTYDRIFDVDIYNNMNGLEKQDVLLQMAAIVNYDGNLPCIQTIENNICEGEYIIENLENGVIQDGVVSVNQGGIMTLTIPFKRNCEYYLYLADKLFVKVTIDDEYIKYKEITTLGMVSTDTEKKITIEFLEDVTFELDRLNIYYYDFESYEEYIKQRDDGSVSDIVIGTNTISCNVNVDRTKVICVAAPYDNGWHAEIDGVKTRIYRVNSMFMAVEVPEGEHSIYLYYITPGLRVGAVASIAGVIIVCLYIVLARKRN